MLAIFIDPSIAKYYWRRLYNQFGICLITIIIFLKLNSSNRHSLILIIAFVKSPSIYGVCRFWLVRVRVVLSINDSFLLPSAQTVKIYMIP